MLFFFNTTNDAVKVRAGRGHTPLYLSAFDSWFLFEAQPFSYTDERLYIRVMYLATL